MGNRQEQIEKRERYLEKVNERIAVYEKTAKAVGGKVSRAFSQHMADAVEQRDRLKAQLRSLRLEDALTWSSSEGVLQVCDEIGHRLDEAFRHLEHHSPSKE